MNLLRRYPQFETTDLDEIRALTAASLHQCRMEIPARAPFRWRVRTAQADLVRVSEIETLSPLVTAMEPDPRFYVLTLRQGGCEHRQRGRTQRIEPRQLFLYSPAGLLHRSFGADHVMVARIPADLIEREARMAAAQPGPLFEIPGPIPPASPVAKALAALVAQLNRAHPREAETRTLARWLVTMLVTRTANTWEPLLAHGPCGCKKETVLRAEEYMEANRDASIPAVAAAAEVSERALEFAFQCRRGRTPVQMRRVLLLDEAMRQIKRGERSFRQIAQALGVGNEDRLAAEYERQFHETPAATLRRRRIWKID